MKLFSKRNSLIREGRKSNKGFTLVELIVVIVILAILIGVTIGGIYKYVSQSRKNTDINNASSLQSTLSSMCADETVYSWATSSDNKDKETKLIIKWKSSVAVSTTDGLDTSKLSEGADAAKTAIGTTTFAKLIAELCPDGLPASKTNDDFTITLNSNKGNPVLTVDAPAAAK